MAEKMLYFEVWFDGCAGNTMCIRGVRKPTIEEANEFLAEEVERRCGEVYDIDEITFDEAKEQFNVDDEENWPVFGLEKDTRPFRYQGSDILAVVSRVQHPGEEADR